MRTEQEMLRVVQEKASVIRRRRHAVVMGTIVATIVLVGGLAVFAGHGGQTPKQQVSISEPSSSSSRFSTSSSIDETTSSSASVSSALLDSVPSTLRTTTTSTADTTPPPLPAHRIVSVTMTPSQPVTGQDTMFVVNVANMKMNDVLTFHTDATLTTVYGVLQNVNAPSCTDTSLRAQELTFEYHVTFRVAGAHHPIFDVGACTPQLEPEVYHPIDFDVALGPGPQNGPDLPHLWASSVVSADELTFSFQDTDGAVADASIDWGDGSAVEHPDPSAESAQVPLCDASLDYMRLGRGWDAHHTFLTQGPHTVTVTVTSTNCEGGETQTGSSTFTM